MNRSFLTAFGSLAICTLFASVAAADSFTFTAQGGGQGLPAGPWATITLTLNTTAVGCTTVGDPCINFSGTALGKFAFYDQDNGGNILGFNENSSLGSFGSLQFLDCSPNPCAVKTSASYTSNFGTYQYSVDPLAGAATSNLDLYTAPSFSFDVLPQASHADFTSVFDLIAPPSGTATQGPYAFASHICELTTVGGTGCANNLSGFPIHAYVAADPLPEPTSLVLLGTGLLAFVRLQRRKT
jgi:PEP-CTERM motif